MPTWDPYKIILGMIWVWASRPTSPLNSVLSPDCPFSEWQSLYSVLLDLVWLAGLGVSWSPVSICLWRGTVSRRHGRLYRSRSRSCVGLPGGTRLPLHSVHCCYCCCHSIARCLKFECHSKGSFLFAVFCLCL